MFLKVLTVLDAATAIKFCSNVMNHDSDGETVRRLWHGSPQHLCLVVYWVRSNAEDVGLKGLGDGFVSSQRGAMRRGVEKMRHLHTPL